MRFRIALSGIAAGAICVAALWFPCYMIGPAAIVSDWPYAGEAALFPAWSFTAVIVFCGLVLFTFGWVAARWNWSATWRSSLLAGAGAGLIAGCLIFDFIGAFWFGLNGQEEVLRAYSTKLTELRGMVILINAITDTAMSLYLNFPVIVLVGVVLGALGGLASATDLNDFWGRPPREPSGWLFRLSAYSLVIFGVLNLIVTIAALTILPDILAKTIEEYDITRQVALPPVLIPFLGYLPGLIMIFVPLGITWGWTVRGWHTAGAGRILSGFWTLATFAVAFYYLIYRGFLPGFLFVLPQVFWGALAIIVLSFLAGLAFDNKHPEDRSYRLSDWLGYGAAFGVLGGTQVLMSALAYSLILALITVTNIPHLTATGIVEQTPTDQITALFRLLTFSAEAVMLVCFIVGWIVAALVLLIRKIFRIRALPLPER